MSFEIVTDSSCNLPEDIIDRYGLHILSLRFLVGGKEYYSYTKGEITDLAQFYTMMRNKEEITTSQISSDTCTKLFESLLQDGKETPLTLKLPGLTREERDIILAGCLINYYAK